ADRHRADLGRGCDRDRVTQPGGNHAGTGPAAPDLRHAVDGACSGTPVSVVGAAVRAQSADITVRHRAARAGRRCPAERGPRNVVAHGTAPRLGDRDSRRVYSTVHPTEFEEGMMVLTAGRAGETRTSSEMSASSLVQHTLIQTQRLLL